MMPVSLQEKADALVIADDKEAGIDELQRLESMGKMYVAKCPQTKRYQEKSMALMFAMKRLNAFPAYRTVNYSAPVESELDRQIRVERQNATALMGEDSRYALVSASSSITKQTETLKYLFQNFHFSGKHNILLLGGTGSGKTYAAVSYVCAADDFKMLSNGDPKNHAFIRAYTLSECIQRKKWDVLDGLRSKKWLVIDDLGVEGPGYKSGDFLAFFEDMFIERHQNQKRTIMTCNASLEDVKATFGDRFISRLRETGEVFETADPDMRA